MRAVLLAVLCCVGCDAVFGLDEPGGAGGGDAGSQSDGGADAPPAPDGRIMPVPDGDADGDGVRNAEDLCPHIHLDQFGANEDTDADGVGDLCDPAPMVAGDCLLLFDDLLESVATPRPWQVYGAGATVIEERGLVVPLAAAAIVYLDTSLPLTSVFFEAYVAEANLAPTARRAVQLMLGLASPTSVMGQACSLEEKAPGPAFLRVVRIDPESEAEVVFGGNLEGPHLEPGSSLTIAWDQSAPDGATDRCRAGLSAGTEAKVEVVQPTPVGGKPALLLIELGLDLHRVIGYGRCTP